MDNKSKTSESKSTAFLFLIIPTIFLIVGYFIYPFPPSELALTIVLIPIFFGLVLLGAGFFTKKGIIGNKLKMFGWIVFAFYWSTQPTTLYLNEDGDIFNASVCVIGVYILFYLAYHEWLSIKRNENVRCLNWIAGATAIAGIIYFGIERTILAPWLIETTAWQSGQVVNLVIGNIDVNVSQILYNGSYVVTIVFACTAIQAMVVFVGMISALRNVSIKRKIFGLLVTVVPIYFLNLLRNALVVFLLAKNIADLNLAHNIIAKIGALIAMIVLLFVVIKILPEVFDEIIGISDLYKRNGPLEKSFSRLWRKSK